MVMLLDQLKESLRTMDIWNSLYEYEYPVATADVPEAKKCYIDTDTTGPRMSYARAYPWPVAI